MGERNHAAFLFFLLANGLLLVYGTYASAAILLSRVDAHGLMKAKFVHKHTGQPVVATNYIIFTFMFTQYTMLVCAFIMCAVMGVAVMGFWAYHVYLVSRGTTTNEAYKWGLVKAYYKQRAKEAAARGKISEEHDTNHGEPPGTKKGRYAPAKSGKHKPLLQRPDDEFPSEIPRNIYNNGFIENWMVVLRPGASRRKKA